MWRCIWRDRRCRSAEGSWVEAARAGVVWKVAGVVWRVTGDGGGVRGRRGEAGGVEGGGVEGGEGKGDWVRDGVGGGGGKRVGDPGGVIGLDVGAAMAVCFCAVGGSF